MQERIGKLGQAADTHLHGLPFHQALDGFAWVVAHQIHGVTTGLERERVALMAHLNQCMANALAYFDRDAAQAREGAKQLGANTIAQAVAAAGEAQESVAGAAADLAQQATSAAESAAGAAALAAVAVADQIPDNPPHPMTGAITEGDAPHPAREGILEDGRDQTPPAPPAPLHDAGTGNGAPEVNPAATDADKPE